MTTIDPVKEHTESRARHDAAGAEARNMRNGIISLGIFTAMLIALLLAVPSLREAVEHVGNAGMPLIVVGVALELGSCLGYVFLFSLVFDRIGRSLVVRLSLSELAVNSFVSVSGLGGIALGAWVLHSRGYTTDVVARRSIVMWLLASAVNVAAVFVIGIPMWLGLLHGPSSDLLTVLPAFAALAVILGVLALGAWARRFGARQGSEKRLRSAMRAVGAGVFEALELVRSRDPRLLGAVAYWLCDNLVLWATLDAVGATTSFWIVAMAYLVGMLANSIPVPGGLVAVEGGLVGMLLLYGVRPASSVVAAVIIYRAIALWIPAVVGTFAFGSLRREIGVPAPQLPPGTSP
ncbi:MAG TPA: lysylphosphatidylglycerol synthase transmembrane domain-containing protein [Solirubrobacteraceae bacterium]|nr:lysylphosphatidylglycerol synthase transmembrane domain-containing protein [Solirubrobacteraceae bacterium]